MSPAVRPLRETRRYRFGPLDRAGWLLGLGAAQCVSLAVGLLVAGVVLHVSGTVAFAAIPVVVTGVFAFGRWDGRAAHEWVTPLFGWLRLRRRGEFRWRADVALLPADPSARLDVPSFLRGMTVMEVPVGQRLPKAHGVAVVAASGGASMSTAFRIRGREFALVEREDQERILDDWGSALAGFCRERSPVSRVTWSEWAAPTSFDEHVAFVREQHTGASSPELDSYLELVSSAGPLTTAHDVLCTVTIDRRRVYRPRAADQEHAAIDTLLEETQLFAGRLEAAGLTVEPPLSPAELATALRLRCDPSCAARLSARAATFGQHAGVVAPHNWAPMAVALEWRHATVDRSLHRSYWIAEWPRLQVTADWMAGPLLHAGGVRTFTVVYEPVTPSRSRRAIDRDATRLASDEEQRTRRGFRIRAQHRRAETEVLSREAELVAGYAELRFCGFLTVTAPTLDVLDGHCAEWEQVAAQAGLELRALDGQHDLGLLVGLPLGQGPATRGT